MEKAEEFYKLGDEEQAYIFFMKYFNLIEILKNSRDFHEIQGRHREFFGGKDEIMERMDRLGRLQKNLKKRYGQHDLCNIETSASK